jgi:hypothetical protein
VSDRHKTVVALYLDGKPVPDILAATGYKSDQTIYDILNRHGITHRRNAGVDAALNEEVVQRWIDDPAATSRSLADAYGCASTTISAILRSHLSAEQISAVKNAKIARSATLRPDLRTPEYLNYLKEIGSRGCPLAKAAGLAKGAKNSAAIRKGRPLTPEHRHNLAVAHVGLQTGENSFFWRGGTAKVSWRGPGWTIARRDARKRDGNTCQLCGATKNIGRWKNMDVHHIRSFYDFATPAEANVLSNLICLCRTCHKTVECGGAICPVPDDQAKRAGVPVVFVDPRYTSRQCAACGCIDKKNRTNQATFRCVSCGHTANADSNAAINIRSRALVAQGTVMVPEVLAA